MAAAARAGRLTRDACNVPALHPPRPANHGAMVLRARPDQASTPARRASRNNPPPAEALARAARAPPNNPLAVALAKIPPFASNPPALAIPPNNAPHPIQPPIV